MPNATAVETKTYAIIGSGNIGSALAHHLSRAGITFTIANKRGPDSLQPLVKELGGTATAKSLDDAVDADIVLLAIPFGSVEAFGKTRNDWSGKIVIDATNAFDVTPQYLAGRTSSAITAGAFRGAAVVKAFNYLGSDVLARDPGQEHGHRVMFIAGNEDAANRTVTELAARLGFSPIVLGGIDDGGRMLNIGGPLLTHDLIELNE